MLSPDVENVLQIQKNRTLREEQLKQKMISTIKEKINNYAKLGHTKCIYTVPTFIIGEIPFKISNMNKCIVKRLKQDGFYVVKLSIQHIYISWDIKDINMAMEHKNKKLQQENEKAENFSAFVNNNKKMF